MALTGAVLTPVLHLAVLMVNGLDPVASPVSELSRDTWGALHTFELVLFGIAHIALALALAGLDSGRLWPVARGLLVASGVGLVYVAFYFAGAPDGVLYGPDANDPLWIVASLTGFAMGALQPGLSRKSRRLGIFSTVCLGVWLWLIPVVLFVDESWLGAYERLVGIVYVIWLAGVSQSLLRLTQPESVRG